MKGAATVVGIALVIAHGIAFVSLADRARGDELVLELAAPLASSRLALDGSVPPGLASRVTIDDREAGSGAGLQHRRWSTRYRGGFERGVGATQLVGPFQDPAARTCTGRVIVGQRLLDHGPSSIATTMTAMLHAEMLGLEIFGLGDYEKVSKLTLRWAELAKHPDDAAMIGAAPTGYVRVTATVEFERVDIPLVVALVPELVGNDLRFRIATRAELDFSNRVLQWASDKLGGNKLATRLAARELDASLITTLAPPPPFDFTDGQGKTQRLEFTYCGQPPQVVEGAYAALPFAVAIGRVDGDRAVLPPRLGPGPHPAPAADTTVALDLDLDALNALMFELWRSGYLDRQLAEVGLDRAFNADPIVTEYLSIRISPVRLALPPVLTADARGLRLAADGRVAIADGSATTTGRVWGGLAFAFVTAATAASVDLRALELSCERTATTLVPCYADLVAALRDRGADFHGVLTTAFAKLISDIFVEQRVGASGMPVDLVIRSARPSVTLAPPNATLRLELDAVLAPVTPAK